MEQYGEQCQIVGINVAETGGQALYQMVVEHFQLPQERLGVPALIVGDTVLIGSLEIPEQFPGIIEAGLENGGIDWPAIPGLLELIGEEVETEAEPDPVEEPGSEVDQADPEGDLAEGEQVAAVPGDDPGQENSQDDEPPGAIPEVNATAVENEEVIAAADPPDAESGLVTDLAAVEELSMTERFMLDRAGNTLSVFVLLGMVASVFMIGAVVLTSQPVIPPWPGWLELALMLVGLGVAAYMAYVEVLQVDAVCGPVGDCNTVQQSSYARLFGVLPIGVMGVLGYLALITAWLVQYHGPGSWRKFAVWAVWGMALFGVLFSIYLTFLEPFFIGASCAWCLTSAVVMTLLLWAATPPVMQNLRDRQELYS